VVQNYDSDTSDHTTGKSQPKILEAQGKHWPLERKRNQCHLYTAKTKEWEVQVLTALWGCMPDFASS